MSRIRRKDLPAHVLSKIAQLDRGQSVKRRSLLPPPKPEWDGVNWDSKEEYVYGCHLCDQERKGKIMGLDRQIPVRLHVGERSMRIDFYYFHERLAEWIWDEYKAANYKRDPKYKDWRVKADIWAAGLGPGTLFITTRRVGGNYHNLDIRPKANPEALERILRNADMTMNPEEFRKILAAHKAQ